MRIIPWVIAVETPLDRSSSRIIAPTERDICAMLAVLSGGVCSISDVGQIILAEIYAPRSRAKCVEYRGGPTEEFVLGSSCTSTRS